MASIGLVVGASLAPRNLLVIQSFLVIPFEIHKRKKTILVQLLTP